MKEQTWRLTDHVCMGCGGRVLKCATGGGMSPGGNPLWRCADCGKSGSDMSAACVCWCGFAHRGQHDTAYRCLAFREAEGKPALLEALAACGCQPGRGEVGIVLEKDLRRAGS